jgi:tetratricopeptide (TPR) repeat protein
VDSRIVWITLHAIYDAIEIGDDKLFNEAIHTITPFDNGSRYTFKEMDGRMTGVITSKNLVFSCQMAFYHKIGDTVQYSITLSKYIESIWDDWDELNSIAWEYYESVHKKDRLQLAKKWVIRSIELNSNYANNDTYAALLYKLKDYRAALQQANEAISVAKKHGENYDETTTLIEMIKKNMSK